MAMTLLEMDRKEQIETINAFFFGAYQNLCWIFRNKEEFELDFSGNFSSNVIHQLLTKKEFRKDDEYVKIGNLEAMIIPVILDYNEDTDDWSFRKLYFYQIAILAKSFLTSEPDENTLKVIDKWIDEFRPYNKPRDEDSPSTSH